MHIIVPGPLRRIVVLGQPPTSARSSSARESGTVPRTGWQHDGIVVTTWGTTENMPTSESSVASRKDTRWPAASTPDAITASAPPPTNAITSSTLIAVRSAPKTMAGTGPAVAVVHVDFDEERVEEIRSPLSALPIEAVRPETTPVAHEAGQFH
jgi:hypothetical protein